MPDLFVANDQTNSSVPPAAIHHSAPKTTHHNEPQPQQAHTKTNEQVKEAPFNPIPQVLSNNEIPYGIRLHAMENGERILLLVRRARITNTPWILTGGLLLIGPLMITTLLSFTNLTFPFSAQFIFIVTIFYYEGVFTYLFVNFIIWFYNISLVTTRRIVDIDYQGLVFKNVSATMNDKISDVSFHQKSAVETFFNYGDIRIQTQGTQEEFLLEKLPRPGHLVKSIQELIGTHHHDHTHG